MYAKTLRRAGCSALFAFALAASPASAGGGKDIASATPVVYGQLQTGNTAQGGVDTNENYRSWWSLAVTSGDEVTIDWQAFDTSNHLVVFPVGTTDFTFTRADYFADDYPDSTLKSQLRFTASQSGSMPMEFFENSKEETGPYAFTAYVRHAVRLAVPRSATLPATGALQVQVTNPDGGAINDAALGVALQVRKKGGKKFATVGTGSAANGTATINYSIPARLKYKRKKRNKVDLRVVAGGVNYVTETSSTQKVKVK